MAGKVVLITGATGGIGRAAATQMAELGASVHLLIRDPVRAARVADDIQARTGRQDVAWSTADLASLDQVRAFTATFLRRHGRLDVLVHNAGGLSPRYQRSADGFELTAATQVLAPFLLTQELEPALRAGAPSRIVTVSSGGMYAARLDVARLDPDPGTYRGAAAYALAKRAQVVLTGQWARRLAGPKIVAHVMHPGWVDTPGLRGGMPRFHRLARTILRTPEQGADTVVWLAAAETPTNSGDFWLDRKRRGRHRFPTTREPAGEGDRLWAWCEARVGPG
jgi:NAD(P)-dependent dehydrogenase (short-subunit alcohol dehydrogenase family)